MYCYICEPLGDGPPGMTETASATERDLGADTYAAQRLGADGFAGSGIPLIFFPITEEEA